MIASQLGYVQLTKLSDEKIKRCEQEGIDANELLQNTLFADFYVIMCALVDEYGLETVLQEVTKNCEQLINERTNTNDKKRR